MANNGDSGLANWADDRLRTLTPTAGWEPDTGEAWRRLLERRGQIQARRNLTMALGGAAVLGTAAAISFQGGEWWPLRSGSALAGLKPVVDRPLAPDFTLPGRDGRPVQLSHYRGRVVLLDFWATWCPPCAEEIPWFTVFQRAYDSRGLTVLGVSMDETGWPAITSFVDRVRVNYPMVVGTDELAKLYRVESLPTTFVIDRSGRIAATHVGLVSRRAVESEIRYLIEQP